MERDKSRQTSNRSQDWFCNWLRVMLDTRPKLGLRGRNSDDDFTSSLLLADRTRWRRQRECCEYISTRSMF
jgi:hypothetical protein